MLFLFQNKTETKIVRLKSKSRTPITLIIEAEALEEVKLCGVTLADGTSRDRDCP